MMKFSIFMIWITTCIMLQPCSLRITTLRWGCFTWIGLNLIIPIQEILSWQLNLSFVW